MEALHRKLSMALGIAPGTANLEQQVDLLLDRNAELEQMVASMTLQKASDDASLLAAAEEITFCVGQIDVQPKTAAGLFAVLIQNFNRRRG